MGTGSGALDVFAPGWRGDRWHRRRLKRFTEARTLSAGAVEPARWCGKQDRAIRSKLHNAAIVLLLAGLAAFFVLVRPHDVSVGGKKTVIRVWHVWGGPVLESYLRGVTAFEDAHPGIACDTLFVPNDLSNSQKFYTAVVGNCAPEVVFIDGPQVAEWAERGLLTPLDDLLTDSGYDPARLRNEFFEPCWKQCRYRGRTWAITYCADPNFVLFWNKDSFRQAIEDGDIAASAIDPDRPPTTLADLDLYTDAITKYAGTGVNRRLVRVGLVPWGVYGRANSIFTWGWAFGGTFYDEDSRRVTADDPRIVQALEWMIRFAAKHDRRRIAALQSTFGSAQRNPFIVGKQAIQLYHLSGVDDLDKYTLSLGLAMFRTQYGSEYGQMMAVATLMVIPIVILFFFAQKTFIQGIKTSGMKM